MPSRESVDAIYSDELRAEDTAISGQLIGNLNASNLDKDPEDLLRSAASIPDNNQTTLLGTKKADQLFGVNRGSGNNNDEHHPGEV